MKFKNILYMFLMAIFMVLAYLLIDRGLNAKTKIYINYQDDSDIMYKVYLEDGSYINMGERYYTDIVNYIDFEYYFKSLFTSKVNGYYSYNIDGNLVVYNNDIDDVIFQKRYILLTDIVEALNSNGNTININSKFRFNYKEYKAILEKVSNEYGIDANGYFEIRFNIFESLNFDEMDNIKEDNKQMRVVIPLSYETFKISVYNDKKNVDSYYDFSKKQAVNYFLMILGIFSLSLGLSFLSLVIRDMINIYKNENKYNIELEKIFNTYGDIIVKVKRFYNKKKYNLIYVDSFKELMDVYNKVGNPISFREVKKNSECIFLLMDGDNAWIYRMEK